MQYKSAKKLAIFTNRFFLKSSQDSKHLNYIFKKKTHTHTHTHTHKL